MMCWINIDYMTFSKLKKLNTAGRRIIAVSDVHGRGDLLRELLQKIGFCADDALFLLGDYIEKGGNSLDAVRLAMGLEAAGNAFCLQGNCDTLWDDLLAKRYRLDIVGYMDWRGGSLLSDMCSELGLDYHKEGPEGTTRVLAEEYGDIFAWLRELPQIIETERFVFAHAGIDDGPLDTQEPGRCLRRDAFMEEEHSFKKTVVCGHMPIANYAHMMEDKLSYNPFFDKKGNVISIDGGMSVKDCGQLNALICNANGISHEYVDMLPQARVISTQEGSREWFSIVWNHNELELIRKDDSGSLCRSAFLAREIIIPNDYLFESGGALRSWDYTTYRPALAAGDVVSVVNIGKSDTLIKKNGVLGWIDNGLLTLL